MKKLLILGLVLMLCLAPMVLADGLKITDLKAYVDGKKDSGVNEVGGTIDNVIPESTVKVKFKIKNDYASSTEITNVEISGVLENIDDGDDIEEESSKEYDLDAGDDKSITLEFKIPLIVDESNYKLKITVKGDSTVNNTNIKEETNVTLTVQVEKEKHLLKFYKKILNPVSVSCGKSAELDVGVINIGSNDEEDIELVVSNTDLEFSQKAIFNLDEGDSVEDVRTLKRYRITPATELTAGTYPITLKATYDEGDETLSETVDLEITECKETKVVEEKKEEEVEVKTVSEITTPEVTAEQLLAQARAQPPITVSQETEEKGFMEKYGIAVVVLLYLVVIAVAIVVFAAVFKRRH